MAILAVKLPDVGEGVTKAEIVEWHIAVGDVVREDDTLAAVMTDKATVEIPSLYSGRVVEIGCAVGDTLAIGANLVLIETQAAEADDMATAPTPGSPPPPPISPAKAKATSPAPFAPLRQDTGPIAPRAEGSAPLASPSVRARARENGVDLRRVTGSGAAGRITHADLDAVFADRQTGQRGAAAARAPRNGTRDIPITGMRRKIAERMSLANSRIPHITIVEEVDVTALEDLRDYLNDTRGDRAKLTILPFLTATLTRAFLDHPEMNARFDDEARVVTRFDAAHLGIATMTDAGLVVPVLRHAEALGVFETAAEIARLSQRARDGKAGRDELTGSTFTVTSLGPLGAIATTPIINHPEVAILGINKIAIRPMWDGCEFRPRKMMNISASFDHRVIDGWDAAVFVRRIKGLIEMPATIFAEF